MKRLLTLAVIPLALLAMTGCIRVPGNVTTAPAGSVPNQAPSPKPPSDQLKFGQTFTWENGVAITVSDPTTFTPSKYAAIGAGGSAYVRMKVTLTNGSSENLDIIVYPSLQSGTTAGEDVFDTENGLNGAPSGPLLPGRSVSWDIGFGVSTVDDLVLSISPGFDYKAAFFIR